jgi:hypothetical protein
LSSSGAASSGGGSSSSGAASSGGDGGTNYNTPEVCTSGKTYTSGTGPTMRPGAACNSCHSFGAAGTVYPTAHEPLLCDGTSDAATVVITDANGASTTLTLSSVGNFYSNTLFAAPFTAKVVYNGLVREMTTPQENGDCNSCHTEAGANGAPGRIMLP